MHGEVHDENAFVAGGIAGHAGLFSTAADLAVLVRTLAAGGRVQGCRHTPSSGIPCARGRDGETRVFEGGTVERYRRRASEASSRALGWDTPSGRSSAGDLFSSNSFGHTGFTGTSVWIDPELDLWVVVLTNRVNPTRANTRHIPFRRAVHDAAATAIIDRPVVPRETPPSGNGGGAR